MEEKLIELVRQNKILYDKSKSGYRNEDLKLKAWAAIAKELKKSVEDVRKRWKTLRDKFTRERKKQNNTTGSAAASPKRQWKFYHLMEFLMDVPCTNNRTISNFRSDGDVSAAQLYENFSPDLDIDVDGSLLFDEHLESQESTSSTNQSDKTQEGNPSFRRKRRTLHSDVLLQNTHQEMGDLIKDARQALGGASMSPLQLCFLGLAKEVETSGMSFAQRSNLQIKVTALVHQEISEQVQNI